MSDAESPFWAAARGEVPPPPAAALLGWKVLEAVPDSGEARVEFLATSDFLNPTGAVSGGFLAAMLDDTVGPALATTFGPNDFAPTLELKVSFIAAARPGPIFGSGRVVHRGKSVAFLEGELRDAEGKLLATATSTARITQIIPDKFQG